MNWKDTIRKTNYSDPKVMDEYVKDGKRRDMNLKEFAKKIEPMMEQILNYHVFDESDYNDETRDKLQTALNQAFNFDRIEVDYVPDDSAYYIDLTGEKSGGEFRTYKFDKNGRFEFVR